MHREPYRVIAKSNTTITVKDPNNNDFVYDIGYVLNPSNVLANPEEISIGDPLIVNQNCYFEMRKYTTNKHYPTSEYLGNMNKPWFSNLYPFCRPCDEYSKNFYLMFGIKICEYSYTYKTNHLFDKMKEILPSRHLNFIEYLESKIPYESVLAAVAECICSSNRIHFLIEQVSQFYNSNLEKMIQAFDIKFEIISIPEYKKRIINTTGGLEFTFMMINESYEILYTRKEKSLIDNYGSLGLVESYNSAASYWVNINDIRDTAISVKEKKRTVQRMCGYILKDLIAKGKFNFISPYLEQLRYYGLYTQEIYETLNQVCFQCHSNENLISLECQHFSCLNCYVEIIGSGTDGLFVFSRHEQRKEVFCHCGTAISDDHKSQYLPNYQYYYNEALNRSINQCLKCNQNWKSDSFIINCYHMCNDCVVEFLVRKNLKKCEFCEYEISNKDINELLKLEKVCDGDLKVYPYIKNFSKKICKHLYCLECIRYMKVDITCILGCGKFDLNNNEYDMLLSVKCRFCPEVFGKAKYWSLKNCNCEICINCLSKDQYYLDNSACPLCKTTFNGDAFRYIEHELQDKKNRENIQKYCPSCMSNVPYDDYVELFCSHGMCKTCFSTNKTCILSDISLIENLKKCPECEEEISPEQLQFLLTPDEMHKFNTFIFQKTGELVTCPKCRERFEGNISRKVSCLNKNCNYTFCKRCQHPYHEDGDCEEIDIQERIKMLEKEEGGVTQCPKCRWPYIKRTDTCLHATCINPVCGIDFCFSCAAVRSPILEHGNHYHRPNCGSFSDYKGKETQKPNCSECKKAGKLCERPKKLKVPRLVAKDEAIK